MSAPAHSLDSAGPPRRARAPAREHAARVRACARARRDDTRARLRRHQGRRRRGEPRSFAQSGLHARPRGRWLEGTGPAIWHSAYAELQRYDVGRMKPGTAYAKHFPQQNPSTGRACRGSPSVRARAKGRQRKRPLQHRNQALAAASRGDTCPRSFRACAPRCDQSEGMERRVTIQSFDWRTLKVVQKEAPDIPTVYLTAQDRNLRTTSRSGQPVAVDRRVSTRVSSASRSRGW